MVPYESANFGLEKGFGLSELAVEVRGIAAGPDLSIVNRWQVELYNPLATGDGTSASVEVTYTLTIENANGNFNIARTATLTPDGQVDYQGGTMRYFTAGWTPDAAPYTELGFLAPPAPWRVQSLIINRVVVYYGSRILQVFPRSISPASIPYQRFIAWTEAPASHPGTASAFNYVSLKDPLFAPVDPQHANYSSFYTLGSVDGGNMLGADPTAAGSILTGATPGAAAITTAGLNSNSISYNVNTYCQPDTPNDSGATVPFTRVGQLGRVHSAHSAQRSMILWNLVDTSWPNEAPDTRILDMFYVTQGERGRVNLNTRDDLVLNALFSGVFSVGDMTSARNAFRYMNNTPARYRGDLGRLFADASFATRPAATQDSTAEAYITQLIELLEVRDQYFTAVVTAQALQDIAGFAAAPGAIQLTDTPLYGTLLAEQKMLAILYRDGYTKKVELLRSTRLEE